MNWHQVYVVDGKSVATNGARLLTIDGAPVSATKASLPRMSELVSDRGPYSKRVHFEDLLDWVNCEITLRLECDYCGGRDQEPPPVCATCDGTGDCECCGRECLDCNGTGGGCENHELTITREMASDQYAWLMPGVVAVDRWVGHEVLRLLPGDDVEVFWSGELDPVRVFGDGWVFLWMPIHQGNVPEETPWFIAKE